MKHWDQDDSYEFPGDHFTINNGYDSIINKLVNSCTDVDIKLGQKCSKIKLLPEGTVRNSPKIGLFTENRSIHRIIRIHGRKPDEFLTVKKEVFNYQYTKPLIIMTHRMTHHLKKNEQNIQMILKWTTTHQIVKINHINLILFW